MAIDKHCPSGQLGFDDLLVETDRVNQDQAFEKKTGDLPATWEEGLPFYRDLLTEHHLHMIDAEVEKAMALRERAYDLARKLNNGQPGILADENSSGCILCRETRAAFDETPLWGQSGEFMINVKGCDIRIAMNGIFGIGGAHCYWPGFSAHAVDKTKPFISETGYRSFLGVGMEPKAETSVRSFVRALIAQCLAKNGCRSIK